MTETIGVAICAYKGHLPHLRALFDSIASQTRLPDQVVVRCSSTSAAEFPYDPAAYPFPLECIVCEEYQTAAQNRNVAARRLTTDLVSFMDADDRMHPQRIEVILEGFRRHQGSRILLHHTTTAPDASFSLYPPGDWEYWPNVLYRCPWGSTQLNPPRPDRIVTNGHVSVAREVLLGGIQYDESPAYYGREDTKFSTDVIGAYPSQTLYCPLALSHYIPSFTGGYKA